MRIIPLLHGMEALVDDENYERLRQYRWYASKNGTKWNAKRHAPGTGRRQIYMHRDLLDAPLVDHIDGNGLNNQRSNLRPADKRINTLNGWGAPIEGRNTKGYGGEGRRTGGEMG